ncbi:MAG: hypothetical protein F6K58_10985 [Symploca sp. SIO2E9]|nr:hypothetical protein [Symploca sp. SIO2E9]
MKLPEITLHPTPYTPHPTSTSNLYFCSGKLLCIKNAQQQGRRQKAQEFQPLTNIKEIYDLNA